MQTLEALVASSIFMLALSLSTNISTRSLAISTGTEEPNTSQAELDRKLEMDKVALQAELETIAPPSYGCIQPSELLTKARAFGTTTGLQRAVEITGQAIQVSWSTSQQSEPLGQRIYTPMGLGLCR